MSEKLITDLQGLVDDIAILTSGKGRFNSLDEYERLVYSESLYRLKGHGQDLIHSRGLTKALEHHKEQVSFLEKELEAPTELIQPYSDKIV